MTATLKGKHAIVTGGGQGIGAAIAQNLVAEGAHVSLLGRNPKTLAAHARKIGGRTFTHACDVANESSVRQAFAACYAELGDPYILVNNAGQAEAAPFAETSRQMWDNLMAVNLTGTFLCTQQVIGRMMAAKSGRIVNVASTSGLKGYAKIAAYCASKHGVIGLTRSLALEVAKLGITVNAVCPGYTDTDMAHRGVENLRRALNKSAAEAKEMLLRTNPRGTFITPEEVAEAVVWLCLPAASGVTGAAIPIAGGESI